MEARETEGTSGQPKTLAAQLTEWREHVKATRGTLKKASEWKALSELTQRDYTAKFAMLGNRLPADVAKCKKSYYVLRAAYLHGQSRRILDGFNQLDKWTKEHGGADVFKSVAGVSAYLDQVRALGLDKDMENYHRVAAVKAFNGAGKGIDQPTHGKRKIGALPPFWKTQLLGAVPKTSKYRTHVAAMAVCGCRPSEFEGGGVSVTKVNEDTYEFTIAGKKAGTRTKNGKTFTTGQTLRTITVTRTDSVDKRGQVNPEFIVLERAMKGKTYMELSATATAIRDVVIHASEKAFPELKNKPTAYSFRHAFASNLKAQNGTDSVETAAALGHSSTKTQGCYGYGRSGGGGLACQATATDRIRTPHLGREVGLAKARAKKNAVRVSLADSIATLQATAKAPDVNLQMAKVAARIQKPEPPKPAPSFAKPLRFL